MKLCDLPDMYQMTHKVRECYLTRFLRSPTSTYHIHAMKFVLH